MPRRRDTLCLVALDYETAMAFIASVPKGCWTTYGDVADAAGNRDAARTIGEWLRESGGSIPVYWRVINANGEVPDRFIASTPPVRVYPAIQSKRGSVSSPRASSLMASVQASDVVTRSIGGVRLGALRA
jgi:6-O-methylguanine DNA methyltransferase, DNA binding domain